MYKAKKHHPQTSPDPYINHDDNEEDDDEDEDEDEDDEEDTDWN